MKNTLKNALHLLLLALLATLPACQSDAMNKNSQNSFLDNKDLVSMTDLMAQSIIGDPDVARATTQKPMVIVMKPIVNETNEIIRGHQKELYVHRLRTLLSTNPTLRTRFTFVLNKVDYETLQKQEGMDAAALGTPEERAQPEYALWGHFYADTNASAKKRSDVYFCQYKLTTLSGQEAGVILWEDKYETQKSISKSLLD